MKVKKERFRHIKRAHPVVRFVLANFVVLFIALAFKIKLLALFAGFFTIMLFVAGTVWTFSRLR